MGEQQDAGPAGKQFVWPGFGLVMGAGFGSVVGLLLFPTYFFLGIGGGAGLGLVIGAIIGQSRDRSRTMHEGDAA